MRTATISFVQFEVHIGEVGVQCNEVLEEPLECGAAGAVISGKAAHPYGGFSAAD